jgi:hypothetical protein
MKLAAEGSPLWVAFLLVILTSSLLMQAARSLIQALGLSASIQVAGAVLDPRELLVRCVVTTARYLITVLAFKGQVRQSAHSGL